MTVLWCHLSGWLIICTNVFGELEQCITGAITKWWFYVTQHVKAPHD